jgi:hypothetical protein
MEVQPPLLSADVVVIERGGRRGGERDAALEGGKVGGGEAREHERLARADAEVPRPGAPQGRAGSAASQGRK